MSFNRNHRASRTAFLILLSLATFQAAQKIAGVICRADDAATTQPSRPTFHAPDGVTDPSILSAATKANELVDASAGFMKDIDAFMKSANKFATPKAAHRGTNTVSINCLMKNGKVESIECNNEDGSGFSLEDIHDAKVGRITTMKFEKPDGFSIQLSKTGLITTYIEFHEGFVQGKAIEWDDAGKLIESRQYDEPTDPADLMNEEKIKEGEGK